jgi:hypothetical protein
VNAAITDMRVLNWRCQLKLYMSRMIYRMEMPKEVVTGNFRNAAELAAAEGIIKNMPDWNDFIRPQIVKEVAPDRAPGW